MIDGLIKLANHLDVKGLTKEADYLDKIIKSAMGPDLMVNPEGSFVPPSGPKKELIFDPVERIKREDYVRLSVSFTTGSSYTNLELNRSNPLESKLYDQWRTIVKQHPITPEKDPFMKDTYPVSLNLNPNETNSTDVTTITFEPEKRGGGMVLYMHSKTSGGGSLENQKYLREDESNNNYVANFFERNKGKMVKYNLE